MTRTIRIGTRGSDLALEQTNLVIQALQMHNPGADFEIETIKSEGDLRPDVPLETLGRGVFVSSLEEALVNHRIDVAVHSMKDLPTESTSDVTVISVLEREDPRDVLIDGRGSSLSALEVGAKIGTSSLRRKAQINRFRSDLIPVPLRGNVDTRLRQLQEGHYDAVILAAAGVLRLGLTDVSLEYLPSPFFAPAAGQGALAVEVRSQDKSMINMVKMIEHPETALAVEAERSVLRSAGLGCQVPVGVLASVESEFLRVIASAISPNGEVFFDVEVHWSYDDPTGAGREAYDQLIQQGAGTLLGELRQL